MLVGSVKNRSRTGFSWAPAPLFLALESLAHEARVVQCRYRRSRFALGLLAIGWLLAISPLPVWAADESASEPLSWREEHRAFWSDGPGLLLTESQRQEFRALDDAGRERFVEEFLRDPIPATERNELASGIERRRFLLRRDFQSWLDDRARIFFLHGAPTSREHIDCDQVYKPIEIWRFSETGPDLVFYRPSAAEPFRLWLPIDSKRALYRREMEYWLDQFHELRQYIRGRRFDLQLCRTAERVDEATGIDGLVRYRNKRPSNEQLAAFFDPPAELAAWARAAAEEPVEVEQTLPIESVAVSYPEQEGQRILSRLAVQVSAADLEAFQEEAGEPEYRLQVTGFIEHEGRIFDQFRVRYVVPVQATPKPIALVLDQPLRSGRSFLFRLRVEDEIGGRFAFANKAVLVPLEPVEVEDPIVPVEAVLAVGDQMAQQRIPGRDDLVLVPPETDLIFGLWRAEILLSGERVTEVRFLVDDQLQFTRKRPPFTAELRLAQFPSEQLIRVEGYDEAGELVDSDELLINQQRGELRVIITSPARGAAQSGRQQAAAEVVIPEERRVRKVEFLVNGNLQQVREEPPWRAEIEVPELASSEDVTYLTVVAELDNGLRAEDVRFLNVPAYLDEVEVDLVELYTSVTDRSKRPVSGLEREDFTVSEDGRRQQIAKFEVVQDLPLTLGVCIDTSGSMAESLGEARRAALDFLESIVTPRDRTFTVRFDDRPELMLPRTSDVGAVAQTLDGLMANGSTALHDAIVTSLYYFRGVRGRRALVLLSDGDDTASSIPFRESLEYARRSGVAIYSIGLNIGRLQMGVRDKLSDLSRETGGRAFFIGRATDLAGVYEEIEKELRSQYLVAYNSDRPTKGDGEFRAVEVKVRGSGLEARTIRGYYP